MNTFEFTIVLISVEILFLLLNLRALRRVEASASVLLAFAGAFLLWLGFSYYVLSQDLLSRFGNLQIGFTLMLIFPLVVGLSARQFWQGFSQVVSRLDTEAVLTLQLMRAPFGVLFFFTDLPFWFQLVGGIGDILAGVAAYIALNRLKNNPDKVNRAIFEGNITGILDFMVVLSFGAFVVIPGLPAGQPFSDMFNLIPFVVVPVFILLHVFSLQKLQGMSQQASYQA